jgi:hypothetical protein
VGARAWFIADPVFGCELVTRVDKDGYGLVGRDRAHILAWVNEHGPVPDDRVLDHLCRRRNCKALHHLEPVTQSENEKRKHLSYRMQRTHCARGHSLTDALMTLEGGRLCRTCHHEAKGRT